MLKKIAITFVLVMLVLSLGCDTQKKGDLPSQPEDLTGEESVDEITEQMSDIDQLEQDLDFSELNSLEEDLANLDW